MDADSKGDMGNKETTDGCYVKARHVLTLMAFLAKFNMYLMRTNLSVAIVAMVNSTTEFRGSNTSQVCSDSETSDIRNPTGGNLDWDIGQQGFALGCYYYGYVFSSIPGGYLASRYGIKKVLGISTLMSSVVTILSPLCATNSFELFVAARILLGTFQGPVSPSLLTAWGVWAPPLELTKMVAIASTGNSIGTLVAFPMAGLVAKNFGWEAVFYVTGGIALPCSILWLALIHDTPGDHPRISSWERTYIETATRIDKEDSKLPTPWLTIMTSVPLWASISGHFASSWGSCTLLALLPTYLSSVLNVDLVTTGTLSSLPYVMQFVVLMVMGYLSDSLRKRRILTTLSVRKWNSFFCLVVPSIFMVSATYSGCDVTTVSAFFCISVAMAGCNSTGHEANIVDIAPRFSGVCFGIANAVGSIPGFLAPHAAGLILLHDESVSQWQKIFWMSGAINLVGFLIFLTLASGTSQEWNEDNGTKEKPVDNASNRGILLRKLTQIKRLVSLIKDGDDSFIFTYPLLSQTNSGDNGGEIKATENKDWQSVVDDAGISLKQLE